MKCGSCVTSWKNNSERLGIFFLIHLDCWPLCHIDRLKLFFFSSGPMFLRCMIQKCFFFLFFFLENWELSDSTNAYKKYVFICLWVTDNRNINEDYLSSCIVIKYICWAFYNTNIAFQRHWKGKKANVAVGIQFRKLN